MTTSSFLCIKCADQFRKCFLLDQATITLGTDSENLLVISDPKAASHHAEISKNGSSDFLITALGNETLLINGSKSKRHSLSNGDCLQIGQSSLHFELNTNEQTSNHSAEAYCRLLIGVSELNQRAIDADSLLHESLMLLFRTLAPDRSGIFLYNEYAEEVQIVSSVSRVGCPNSSLSTDEPIVAEIIRTKSLVQVGGKSDGAIQAIGVPIVFNEKLIGGISLEASESPSDATNQYDQRTVDLLLAVGQQLSVTLNSFHYRDELEKRLPLYTVGKALASLEHQIMNIWQGLMGGVFVLEEEGLKQEDLARAQQGWSIIRRDQNRLLELIKDVLSFNQKHELKLEFIDLRKLITVVVNEVRFNHENLKSMIHWNAPNEMINAMADAELITNVIRNLVLNAIEACSDVQQPQISIELNYSNDEQQFEISVIDNGVGISAERIPLLKSPFETTKPGRKIGIGLAYSQKCIEKHEGELRIKSNVNQGSKFTMIMPDANKLSKTTLEFGQAPIDRNCN